MAKTCSGYYDFTCKMIKKKDVRLSKLVIFSNLRLAANTPEFGPEFCKSTDFLVNTF